MPAKKMPVGKSKSAPNKGDGKNSASTRSKSDLLAREIGNRLAEARDGLGWSQQILATRTKITDPDKQGVSRAVLSLYENGVNKPGAREIMLLCETLKVSPNWLIYGSDSPAKTLQASMTFLRGSEVKLSARLAFAMLALDPEDRDSIGALTLSLLNKKMGDVKLSSLMMMAMLMEDKLLAGVVEIAGEGSMDKPVREVLDMFTKNATEAAYTDMGNLRPLIPEDQLDDFDPTNPPPPRTLK